MRQFLQDIDPSLGIYPVLAFLIFAVFFIIMLVMVYTKDSKTIDKIKNLPLEDSDNVSNTPQS